MRRRASWEYLTSNSFSLISISAGVIIESFQTCEIIEGIVCFAFMRSYLHYLTLKKIQTSQNQFRHVIIIIIYPG